MVTELKSKYYTYLDPIASAGPASLTCFQGSDLDHQNNVHRLNLVTNHQHTSNRGHTYTKQTKLQLEQYTNINKFK